MSILSPADRTVLWHTVTISRGDERASLLRVLAREVLDSAGRRLDLYTGHEDEVITTIELLDESGLLGRDDLREAFEEADEDDDHAQTFAALLADHLMQTADVERLGVDRRLEAMRLAGVWRGHVLERAGQEPEWLTASQVAARYGVTPQAVYKWIKAGRVQAEQTPGGSWRLPADQFSRGRVELAQLAELQAKLLEHRGDAPALSNEEIADEIVRRRRS